MTQFIIWLKKDDVNFRAAYLAKTGEKIQKTPAESEDGLSYMAGSWRVSEKHLDELKADRDISTDGDIKTQKDTPPDGWVKKVEVEI